MFLADDNFLKSKVNEYVYLLQQSGYVNDSQKLQSIRNQLFNLRINVMHNAPAEAMIDGNVLNICYENMQQKINRYGEFYIDEVFFHEFSHVINDFHQSIFGNNSYMISDYMALKMDNFTSPELLLESDSLLYNQDPCLGVLMLDEYIAQRISQDLVRLKSKHLWSAAKKDYDKDNGLRDYETRDYVTNITEPPMRIKTSFATYQEFDICAQKFMKKYGFSNYQDFIRMTLTTDGLKKFITHNKYQINKLFIDLCYLGIIRERIYVLKGFDQIDDKKDPALDPKKVGMVLRRILK